MLGPYGNRFHLHVASDDLRHALGTAGRPGSEKSTCVGMDALTLEVSIFCMFLYAWLQLNKVLHDIHTQISGFHVRRLETW